MVEKYLTVGMQVAVAGEGCKGQVWGLIKYQKFLQQDVEGFCSLLKSRHSGFKKTHSRATLLFQ